MKCKAFGSISHRDQALEVASIATAADPNYLPLPILGPFVNHLWLSGESVAFAATMIELALGLPIPALTSLQQRDETDSPAPDFSSVTLCGDEIAVPIRLRTHYISTLHLKIPYFWLDGLPQQSNPFRDVVQQIRRLGRSFREDEFPIAPTIHRTRASSSRHMGPGILSRLDRAYVSGTISRSIFPSAHYVHAKANAVRGRFRDGLVQLQAALAPYADDGLRARLLQPPPEQPTDDEVIEYLSHSGFHLTEVLKGLRQAAVAQWDHVDAALSTAERARRILSGTQAACGYAYCLQSIPLALRATGQHSEYQEFGESTLRIREKDSADFREQRIGQLIGVAAEQRRILSRVIGWLADQGLIEMEDETLPMFPALIGRNGALRCGTMSRDAFHETCAAAGVSTSHLAAMNAGRHIAASLLNHRVSEIIWHGVLGLHVGSFGADSKFAMFERDAMREAYETIDKWLRSRQLLPIAPGFMP